MMKKSLTFFFIFFLLFGCLAPAEAARFGGGRSFGMQRSMGQFSRYAAPKTIPAQKAARNNWAAPLTGLALGGLLASLFMGNGIGTGLLTWFAVFIFVGLLWNLLRPRSLSMQNQQHFQQNNPFNRYTQSNGYTYQNTTNEFGSNDFIRNAKVQFMRLQAAYDKKDLNDLCEFTTPEVFAEIQMQLKERGEMINITEVVSLDAELMDASSEPHSTLATVKFSGMIKEDADAKPAFFTEHWHFKKDRLADQWLVAGVEQA